MVFINNNLYLWVKDILQIVLVFTFPHSLRYKYCFFHIFCCYFYNRVVDCSERMLSFRGAGGEHPRRLTPVGSHLSRCSRRTLNKHPQINTARRKCECIFEDLAPSAPINLFSNRLNKTKMA